MLKLHREPKEKILSIKYTAEQIGEILGCIQSDYWSHPENNSTIFEDYLEIEEVYRIKVQLLK